MPDFWDLPKNCRDIIYRQHLVYDKPITIDMHRKIIGSTGSTYSDYQKRKPPIFHVSKKAEREATPFYYEMNVFDVGNLRPADFSRVTFPRHWNRVRKVVAQWIASESWRGTTSWGQYGAARTAFIALGRMKKLQDLSIQLDESKMVERMHVTREVRQRPWRQDVKINLTTQQSLAILRFPGIAGLLTLTKVKNINFVKLVDDKGVESGGMIPGGGLEQHVLPRLRPKLKTKRQKYVSLIRRQLDWLTSHRKGSSFRFLELPPELGNRIYHLLLRIEGPICPSKQSPTSAPKDAKSLKVTENAHSESVLSILSVCKQLHEEAVGIYYHSNSFLFHYPVQLNAFLTAIGDRNKFVKDITMYYHNIKMGGVELADLTFPLLRKLIGLRKLHVIMMSGPHEHGLRRSWYQPSLRGMIRMTSDGANPAQIPGMRELFGLRGLTDLKVRDLQLEKKLEELKKDKAYPKFPRSGDDAKVLRLTEAYEHFNAALADAQLGQVNKRLLEDEQWQWWDVFPTMDSDGKKKA